MIKKGTKLYSIFTGACPKCHQASMYVNKNPYVLKDIQKMHENCKHCGFKFHIEPAFFYGSMYVSYGVGIAFAMAAFIISYNFIGTGLITAFIAIVVTLIGFSPIIMRISRNIWINMFVDYDKEKAK
ncbi:DUF983 domain-containing protein [Bizionia myxarmorum]|uniref:DUF983 domain-containing protein n=1 Tax=Bizionia myxarmorum TaxID=291186 RepID=A0A5D0RBX5_9FLAO|nr:DUF983 domain-containing protein [Bizionia myxarmorum]TYB78208.1 DUF983 domain-containing protein [Bizionia myxarmorum]